jgi:hypothetical protein
MLTTASVSLFVGITLVLCKNSGHEYGSVHPDNIFVIVATAEEKCRTTHS